MIRTIVSLLLLLMSVGVFAADEEIIRLKDGRVLHGVYDEEAGTIAIAGLDGRSSAVIRIATADIVSRTSLEKKEPERNFVEEAKRLADIEAAATAAQRETQEATDREVARRKAERERQIAIADDTNKRKLELAERIREIDREGDDAKRKQAIETAQRDAEEAERQRKAKIIEQQQQAVDAEQLNKQQLAIVAAERAQFDRERAAAAERVRMAKQHEQDRAIAQQRIEQNRRIEAIVMLVFSILGLLGALAVWALPAWLARWRRFDRSWEVTLLLTLTFIAGAALAATTQPRIIGTVLMVVGWLIALIWVLIASKPRAPT